MRIGGGGGIAIVAALGVAALLFPVRADSAEKGRPAGTTHLGGRGSDVVTLLYADIGGTMQFVRVLPDGRREASGFAVPGGDLLVVTDVDFAVPMNATAGEPDSNAALSYAFRIQLVNRADPQQRSQVYLSMMHWGERWGGYILQAPATVGGRSGTMGTGFVVGPGADLRPGLLLPKATVPGYGAPYLSPLASGWVESALPFTAAAGGEEESSPLGKGHVILRGYLVRDR